jgi:methyl-accepting chemotaxis protein
MEETSASLEELASMTKRNSDNARKKPMSFPRRRAPAADKGATDMQAMNAAMDADQDISQRRHRQNHQDH